MRKGKRVVAFLLAVFAFIFFSFGPMTSSANAVVIVDDAVIAIVIAALAAMGITFSYTGGYYTLYDWIQTAILNSGASFTDISAGVNSIGNVLLNNRFVLALSTVATYIKTHWNLDSNGHYQILQSTYGCLDELTGNVYMPGTYTSSTNYTTGTVLFEMKRNEAGGTVKVYNYRFSGVYWRANVTYTSLGNDTLSQSLKLYRSQDGVDYTYVNEFFNVVVNNPNGRNVKIMLALEGSDIWFCMYTGTNQYGTTAGIEKLAKVTGVSIGNDLSIETDFINIPTDQTIGDDAGKLILPVPWGSSFEDVVDEIPDLADAGDLEGNVTLDLSSEQTIAEELDTTLTNQQSVSNNASDYQSPGLQSVFPFCIPFDIYSFFGCLAADPVAPSFTWRFYVPGICDEQFTVDLSAFDTVAQVLRTMELLAFIVGLALVTRDKFLRG